MRITRAITAALSLALGAAGPAGAQAAGNCEALLTELECGGQYECVEDRPLSLAEALASRSHPLRGEQQNPDLSPGQRGGESCATCEQLAGGSIRR